MFDGNHRSRRTINLGGASSSSAAASRRRRQRGGGTTTPSSITTTTTNNNTTKGSGIRDHKAELLEAARVQREARKLNKKQVDSVKCIQRHWRGYKCRERIVERLKKEEEKDGGGGDVERFVKIVCMRTSPALLPFRGKSGKLSSFMGNNSKKEVQREEECNLFLALSSLLSSSSSSSKTILRNMHSKSKSSYQFLMGRLTKRILLLLLENSLKAEEKNAKVNLVKLLIQLLLLDDNNNSDNNKEEEDDEGVEKMKKGKEEITNAISILNTSTNYRPEVEEQKNGLILLFTTFQSLFWSALHSPPTKKEEGEDLKKVVRVLLNLSCSVAFCILQEKQKGGDEMMEDASSLLAAAIFCSGIYIVPNEKEQGTEREQVWRGEFQSCLRNLYRGNEGEEEKEKEWSWYTFLLSNLVSTLTRSSSSTEVASAAAQKATEEKENSITKAIMAMVNGRELYLLRNALDIASSSDNTNNNPTTMAAAAEEEEKKGENFTKSIIQLLTFILQKNKELTVLSALVANGEDLGKFFGEKKEVIDLTRQDEDNEEDNDSDEEDSEDMEEDSEENNGTALPVSNTAFGGALASSARSSSRTTTTTTTTTSSRYTSKRNNHSRVSRQELQTLPKLDSLYKNDWYKVRKEVLSKLIALSNSTTNRAEHVEYVKLTCDLAKKIGAGEMMVQLGSFLFADSSAPVSSSIVTQAKDDYVILLSTLLQPCTSLRSNNSNTESTKPLLTQLAFYPTFLPQLWKYLIEKSKVCKSASSGGDGSVEALACLFCDLFAQYLLAVDDEEFITSFTDLHNGGGGKEERKGIVAEGVILYLSSALHELYWTRPVTANDVLAPVSATIQSSATDDAVIAKCHRARLILSGTKLWNALYERWCRLLRVSPFCKEEVWWFPRLVSRERDDDGVFIVGENDNQGNNAGMGGIEEESDDDMDDDSTASPMDVDGEEGNASSTAAATGTTAAADAESDALASSFRDPKMARILTSIPQSIPFDRRVKLFDSLLNADKARTQDETRAFRQVMMNMRNMDDMLEGDLMGREQVTIRRDNIYGDSMKSLNKLGKKLRRKVQVTFINKHGAAEAGIDGGGVFKEFLDDLITEAFNPQEGTHDENGGYGPLFAVSPLQTLYVGVSPDGSTSSSTDNSRILSHYEFLGRVLGKAVYESILVEPQFCLPFLNKLLGKQNTLDDLKNLDPEYYRNLSALRKMSEEEIENLGLTFELTTGSNNDGYAGWGKLTTKTVELVPGGSSIPVTKKNVIRYVHLVAHRRMNVEGSRETHAFLRGFRDLIPAAWVRLFSSYELQKMISGDDTIKGIDVNSMRSVMQYSGGYHPSQPIIKWLWEVVDEMTPRQQRMFLKFMTSCSRQPLLGFHALVPVPCIQQIRLRDEDWGHRINDGGKDVRLPTSSTCMNLLKLPNYKTKEMLREKLIYAIESAAGFELS